MDQDRRERILANVGLLNREAVIKPGRRTFAAGSSVGLLVTKRFYEGVNSIHFPRDGKITRLNMKFNLKLRNLFKKDHNCLSKAKFIFIEETDYIFRGRDDSWETISLIYSIYDYKTYAVPSNSVRESTIQRKIK